MPQLTQAEQSAIAREVADMLQRRSIFWSINSSGGSQAITISNKPASESPTEAAERPKSANHPTPENLLQPQNPEEDAPVGALNPNSIQAPVPIRLVAPAVRNELPQEPIQRPNYPVNVGLWPAYGYYGAPIGIPPPPHADEPRYPGGGALRYLRPDDYYY